MTHDAKSLIKQGDELHGKRGSLLTLWQEIADNFYPERADFTTTRTLGEDFAAHLDTSYPIIARRDLGNAFSSMLRPTAQNWFGVTTTREDRLDTEGKQWLEWASGVQRRAMYDRSAKFLRATKEGDHDYAAFGQCVISVEFDPVGMHLLYRSWHLRDVVWSENAMGDIDTVHRKWQPYVVDVARLFQNVHEKVKEAVKKNPYLLLNVRHVVIPADQYHQNKKWKHKFVSVYIDVDNNHIMEEVSLPTTGYIIPRWQTVSGSQYAYSPATVAALPDARLIQSMTGVLLEAGEKAASPPMLAVQDAIRSDISIYAGGVTWVDAKYDERLGEVLRPLNQDTRNIPLGIDMRRDVAEMISEAFFLNKLTLPQVGGEMTAFEVGQRVQEYIRQALPLFEPMEHDYNGALCEETFDLLFRWGAFGSPFDLPESLRGADIAFTFESPLHEAADKQKGQKFIETKQILAEAAEIDPMVAAHFDVHTAFRDVLGSIGGPASWITTEEVAAEIIQGQQEAQEQEKMMETMQQGAGTAQQLAAANKELAEAPQ